MLPLPPLARPAPVGCSGLSDGAPGQAVKCICCTGNHPTPCGMDLEVAELRQRLRKLGRSSSEQIVELGESITLSGSERRLERPALWMIGVIEPAAEEFRGNVSERHLAFVVTLGLRVGQKLKVLANRGASVRDELFGDLHRAV